MAGYTRRRVQHLAKNKLEKLLREPVRRQQEQQFRLEHQADTDEALLAWLKEQKRRSIIIPISGLTSKSMKPVLRSVAHN